MNRARLAVVAIAVGLAPAGAGCAIAPAAQVAGVADPGDGVSMHGSAATASPGQDGAVPGDGLGGQSSFSRTFSAPLWVVLVVNLASLVAAGTGAWAALRTNPKTMLAIADKQADVAKGAVAASAASAEAAREAAAASTLNARTAATAAANQGVHAVARLRQEWIDELRSRVAEAHALLANPAPTSEGDGDALHAADLDYRRRANEAVTKIDLMLNSGEEPSRALVAALDAMNRPGLGLAERQARGVEVRDAARVILKAEWDRVRSELKPA